MRSPTTRTVAFAAVAAMLALATLGCRYNPSYDSQPELRAGDMPAVETVRDDKSTPVVSEDALRELGLRAYWDIAVPLLKGDRVTDARMLGNAIILTTEKNLCYAVDASRGVATPLAQVASADHRGMFPPTWDGQRMFFAGRSNILGLNPGLQQVDVKIPVEFPANTQAISDKTYVYVGALNGKVFVYAIDSRVKHWNSKVGSAVTSLAFTAGNQLLVVARSDVEQGRGEIFTIRVKQWTERWGPKHTEGPISAPIVGADDAVFVASEDRSLYKFNALDGWVEWRVRTPGILSESPTLLKDYLVQRVPTAGTWYIDRLGGEVMWKDPAALHYLGETKTYQYYYQGEGSQLVCKQVADGKTVGTAAVDPGFDVMPVANPNDSKLYLVAGNGRVLCCNDLNQPYLTVGGTSADR